MVWGQDVKEFIRAMCSAEHSATCRLCLTPPLEGSVVCQLLSLAGLDIASSHQARMKKAMRLSHLEKRTISLSELPLPLDLVLPLLPLAPEEVCGSLC